VNTQYIVGVDIGGTKCAVILGSLQGGRPVVLEKSVFATAEYRAPGLVLDRCCAEIGRLAAGRSVGGIGIACGGPLDSAGGIILSPPNLPGWDNIPVCRVLEERFGVKAALRNDADACAMAEWRFGAGAGTENFVFLTCGTGLGAGLILNGRLYTGRLGFAGELGHWRMGAYGPVGYGKAGSLEGFFSGGGIAQLAASRLLEMRQQGEKHPLLEEGGVPTAQDVFRHAVELGDPFCMGIVEEAGRVLGRGIAMLADLLNPDAVAGGGIFTRNYAVLEPIVRRVVDAEALPQTASHCRILPSALGEGVGDIAALTVALPKGEGMKTQGD